MALRCLTAPLFVALVATAVSCSAMSIDAGPVKVTQRNSGPRYDVEIGKDETQTRSNQQQDQQQGPPPAALQQPDRPLGPPEGGRETGASSEEPTPIGHVSIRRIFLFPVMRPGDWSQQDSAESTGSREMQPPAGGREHENEHEPVPSMFAKPFWPFMTPARPSPNHQDYERPHRPHLFGSDEASRSPTGDRGQDHAASGPVATGQPIFDPIQMMVDMMHQAINSQLAPNFTTDLNNSKNNKENKETNNNDNSPAESSDERPQMPGGELDAKAPGLRPGAHNETREDIVEIDGKKYLRKTVTNRHVGENIIFMTRRLIFVPLNETDSTTTTTDTVGTTTTDSSPAPTTAPVAGGERGPASDVDRVGNNKPVTTEEQPTPPKSTTEEPTSQAPSSTTNTSTAPTMTASETPNTESSVESTTPPKSSWVERASEAVGKAAERLVEPTRELSQQEPASSSNKKNNESNERSPTQSSA